MAFKDLFFCEIVLIEGGKEEREPGERAGEGTPANMFSSTQIQISVKLQCIHF